MKFACIGSATAETLASCGISADLVPEAYDSEHLADALCREMQGGGAALLLRAAKGSHIRPRKTEKQRHPCHGCTGFYDTVRCCAKADELRERIRNRALDGVTFTSASTVHSFAEAVGRGNLRGLAALCIGPVTAEAAKSYEMKPFTAQEATGDRPSRALQNCSGRVTISMFNKDFRRGGCGRRIRCAAWCARRAFPRTA